MDFITIYLLVVFFVATLVRSTFGFGESLIAVPLLLFYIPIEVAVPLSVLISICIAGIVVVQDHRQIHYKSAKWLILFAALGIPFGLFILVYANEQVVKPGLALLIIAYSLYSLMVKKKLDLQFDNKGWLFICGFFSGVFGGVYGLNGPPLVVYGHMRNWSAGYFRATLQAYFLPASIIGMVGYWYNGLWSSTVTYYFLICLPVVIPAVFLGRYLNQRITDGSFFKYIYIGLVVVGIILLADGFVD